MTEEARSTYDPAEIVVNSTQSLDLAEVAWDAGRFRELQVLIYQGPLVSAPGYGDPNALNKIAARAGLDPGEVSDSPTQARGLTVRRATAGGTVIPGSGGRTGLGALDVEAQLVNH